MGIIVKWYRAWRERRRNRPKIVHKWQCTREEWEAGVRHPELMYGAVGGVSGPLVSVKAAQEASEKSEDDSTGKE